MYGQYGPNMCNSLVQRSPNSLIHSLVSPDRHHCWWHDQASSRNTALTSPSTLLGFKDQDLILTSLSSIQNVLWVVQVAFKFGMLGKNSRHDCQPTIAWDWPPALSIVFCFCCCSRCPRTERRGSLRFWRAFGRGCCWVYLGGEPAAWKGEVLLSHPVVPAWCKGNLRCYW